MSILYDRVNKYSTAESIIIKSIRTSTVVSLIIESVSRTLVSIIMESVSIVLLCLK